MQRKKLYSVTFFCAFLKAEIFHEAQDIIQWFQQCQFSSVMKLLLICWTYCDVSMHWSFDARPWLFYLFLNNLDLVHHLICGICIRMQAQCCTPSYLDQSLSCRPGISLSRNCLMWCFPSFILTKYHTSAPSKSVYNSGFALNFRRFTSEI